MQIKSYLYLIYPVCVAVALAWAVSGWLGYNASSYAVPSFDSNNSKSRKAPLEPDYNLIISKNIMDVQNEPLQPVVEKKVENAGPVTTGFTGKLIGVMHGSGNSYAVVSYNNNKYILIEGEVQDGLELIETGYFHAVVKNNGKEYRLLLDEQGKNADAKRPSSSSVSSGGDTLTSKISRKEVVENLSDVNSVIKTVLITPYERQGKFVGYRIARLSRRSVLNKIGINRGDIVVRLNGRGLTNPTVFFDTLSNAETLNSITLDIERKGVKKTIYVEIEG